MSAGVRRWILVVLALTAVFVGVWAAFAPVSWYNSFPGAGHHWLPVLGPYNEHLARDTGGLYLALLVLSVGSALRPANDFLVRLAGATWLAFSIPHLAYHSAHLDMYHGADWILNVIALGGTVVLAALLLLPVRTQRAH